MIFCSLAYLHESIEPKVVHRDIKSSNILIDKEFNAKVSDFGLAKLLESGESHITTRVMGTFGYTCFLVFIRTRSLIYVFFWVQLSLLIRFTFVNFSYVAPEYANSGLLNEKSDIYSFGVLLLEAITGRDPVDYGRPPDEVLN